MNKILFSSASEEWGTPKDLFEELNEEFHFVLDVCASSENHKCEKYFTKKENGLIQEWTRRDRGACWMNPPYGRAIVAWMQKALDESRKGSTVVCLVPARTDTRWFHDFVHGKADEVRFIRGRIKFDGPAKNLAPFPSMIVVYRGVK